MIVRHCSNESKGWNAIRLDIRNRWHGVASLGCIRVSWIQPRTLSMRLSMLWVTSFHWVILFAIGSSWSVVVIPHNVPQHRREQICNHFILMGPSVRGVEDRSSDISKIRSFGANNRFGGARGPSGGGSKRHKRTKASSIMYILMLMLMMMQVLVTR